MRPLIIIRRLFIWALFLAALYPWQLTGQKMAIGPELPHDTATVDTLSSEAETHDKEKLTLVEKIDNFARKDNLFAKLLRQVWVFNREEDGKAIVAPKSVPSEKSQNYEGKIIRDIHIKVLDAFGYSVNDPVCYDVTFIESIGNRLHYPTRTWIIKNRLLFNSSDSLEMLEITESERLLRQNESITDARIYVEPAGENSDSVDIKVYVQDVWNLAAKVDGNPLKQSGTFNLTDINFIGLGHRVTNNFSYDHNLDGKLRYNGRYFVPEILNSYISANLHFNTFGSRTNYGIGFNRGFFSPTTRWAGGMFYDYSRDNYNITAENIAYSGSYKKLYQDVWAGYALNRGDRQLIKGIKGQLIFSGRVMTHYYPHSVPKPVLEHMHSQNMLLGSIGWSHREFYKDRFLFGFGRTEDIPSGYLLTYTAGIDTRQLFSRMYNGMKVAFGTRNEKIGYTGCSMEVGGYSGRGKLEEGVARTQIFYFTNLIDMGKWHMRHFLTNTLTIGINRRPGEYLMLNSELHGFNVNLYGNQKYTVNYELSLYTPYNWLGFRPIGVLFFDMGLLGNDQKPLVSSRLHKGIGLGIRVRNEHLIFSAIQLSFHFYPGISDYGGNPLIFQRSGPAYRFQSFQFLQPYIIPYY